MGEGSGFLGETNGRIRGELNGIDFPDQFEDLKSPCPMGVAHEGMARCGERVERSSGAAPPRLPDRRTTEGEIR